MFWDGGGLGNSPVTGKSGSGWGVLEGRDKLRCGGEGGGEVSGGVGAGLLGEEVKR